MSSCHFDQLVSQVATMLRTNAPQEDINRFLEILLPDYRAEVLAGAQDMLKEQRTEAMDNTLHHVRANQSRPPIAQ